MSDSEPTQPIKASPFLPGTQIQYAIDSTSLGYLKTCPRLYQYIMIEGWGSTDESIHLRFGSEYHKALEDFDRLRANGVARTDALRQVIHELLIRIADWNLDQETRAGKYKNPRSLIRTIIDYLDHYVDDGAKTFVMANGKPAVELSFRFELEWGPSQLKQEVNNEGEVELVDNGVRQPYLLCGHLDRVVEFADELFVMDHKTSTSTLSSHYFDGYAPSNQMTLYALAGAVVLGSPIRGVIIDAVQILIACSRCVRGITYRTPDQLEEWQDDLRRWLALAETYATEGYWPQNDTACDKFGGCRFREVCSKSPQVREQFLKSRFTKLKEEEKWNPLKPR